MDVTDYTAAMLKAKKLEKRHTDLTAAMTPETVKIVQSQLSYTSAEFRNFALHWGITLQTSSPHAPHTNGRAEAAVKNVKKILKGCSRNGRFNEDDWAEGLMAFRNQDKADDEAPAIKLLGHRLWERIPPTQKDFHDAWKANAKQMDNIARDDDEAMRAAAKDRHRRDQYDRTTRPLPPLKLYNQVLVQHHATKRWTGTGEVVKCLPNREYQILQPSGRVITRLRQFLRLRCPTAAATIPNPTTEAPSVPPTEARQPARQRPPPATRRPPPPVAKKPPPPATQPVKLRTPPPISSPDDADFSTPSGDNPILTPQPRHNGVILMTPGTHKQVENIAYGSDMPFPEDDNPGGSRRASTRVPKPAARPPGSVNPDDYNEDFTLVVAKGRGRGKHGK